MLIAQCFADASTVGRVLAIRFRGVSDRDGGGRRARDARARVAARCTRRCRSATISMRWRMPIRDDTRIVYLANPNNPTGTWFDDAALERFVARVPRDMLVVVDEAYHEYRRCARPVDCAAASAERHPNLIVTRTFSKAYALAGLRVGYRDRASERRRDLRAPARVVQRQRPRADRRRSRAEAISEHRRAMRKRGIVAEREWLAGEARARKACACCRRRRISCSIDFETDAAPIEKASVRAEASSRGRWAATACRNSCASASAARAENERLLAALP